MSRIDELIRELCPKGVPLKAIGEVAVVSRGSSISKIETIQGEVPVLAGGQQPAYWHSEANRDGENIVVAGSGAYAGFVSYWNQPIWASDSFTISGTRELLLTKYCFYWLKNIQSYLHSLKRGSGVPHVYAKDVAKLVIPVPPLEIQREIVSILDKFTQLEAELEAELEARRTQYEVTRDRLLDFSGDLSSHPMGELIRELCPEGVKVYPLGDLIEENLGGGTPSRSQPYFWDGEIAWASVGDLTASHLEIRSARQSITQRGLEASSTKLIPEGWVIAAVKIAPGEMRVVKSPVAINQDLRGLRLKSSLDPRFLVFLSKTMQVSSNGTIVKGITNDSLKRIPIPLPPLEVQREIVSILDKLDALVNDITYGLPAEIEARRKQYEYYRNKLLTFKELDPD